LSSRRNRDSVSHATISGGRLFHIVEIEHQPQRKIDLQQLSTATGGHRADR